MDFYTLIDQVVDLLRQRQRVTYRALQRQFQLDEETLNDLRDELLYAHQVARDEDGRVLVWTGRGDPSPPSPPLAADRVPPPAMQEAVLFQTPSPPVALPTLDAERRQLTVLFCDLVDSTVLASQLDPEDYREVVRAYHTACAKVIARFDGYIAQYLGDGLLVYFGYPQAHEDDAQRAVRAGLGILEALGTRQTPLAPDAGPRFAVRLGIHTGVVVVGEIGGAGRREQLALGETPNIAARLQGLAAPNTLVISAATWRLLGGFFRCQALGTPPLKGVTPPLAVYEVLAESTARSRLEAAGGTGLTPLVGREQEVGVLRERWAQVTEGVGQVVLLSGEAGIGKSRLVQMLQEHVAAAPQAWLTPCQCSSYYQHSALYPLIELLERVALRFEREDTPQHKLSKLEGFLVQYGLPLAEAVPLFAALLSLPLPADYAPLLVSPEQQKQRTLQALLTILLRIAVQQPLLFIMEDLHWADPSTLEWLSLLVEQGPTARILALFTFRPDFSPPWTGYAHLTQVTLQRLTPPQAREMTGRMAHRKALPAEMVEQVVTKADGVPLFVEELTKTVLESGLLREDEDRYELRGPLPPLAIPATLHDALMARLDRLAPVKAVAQLGATIGRTFAYALLQAVAPLDEATLQTGLRQLVEAELLYQQGLPPQATYRFKHSLIQEAAYQSLLKSTRQQYHQRITQVLEERFPETLETQPELLAQHLTAAGLYAPAVRYWQRAGQRALQRSAHAEAIRHLTQGLAVLQDLPHTPEQTLHELMLQHALGTALMATKGYAAPDVQPPLTRARVLCQQLGETPQLCPVLWGLWAFYLVRGELQIARELAEQLMRIAQRVHDPALVLQAHYELGDTLFWLGELVAARQHFEHSIALYDPQQHRPLAFLYGEDTRVTSLSYLSWTLWFLGYPAQALQKSHEALTGARELAHPHSLAYALFLAARLHQLRAEIAAAHERIEELAALAQEQGFAFWVAVATIWRGWIASAQGQSAEGLAQLRQGLAAYSATGAALPQGSLLALLVEAYGKAGQVEEGLQAVDEALVAAHTMKEACYEAELYRLKGELILAARAPRHDAAACFHHALELARHQDAKALELRAAMSLARLWQQQGQCTEAYSLLAEVHGWFTEGFDTADLQEAMALLKDLTEPGYGGLLASAHRGEVEHRDAGV